MTTIADLCDGLYKSQVLPDFRVKVLKGYAVIELEFNPN